MTAGTAVTKEDRLIQKLSLYELGLVWQDKAEPCRRPFRVQNSFPAIFRLNRNCDAAPPRASH